MSRCYLRDRQGPYSYDNSWTSKFTLSAGSAWEDQDDRATLAFEIIMVIALVGTFVWSIISHKRTPAPKKTFVCFLAAISLMIFTSTWDVINRILNEECVRVQQFYLIFNTIFIYLCYLANALLLATIFIYLIPRSSLTRQYTQSTRTNRPTLLHLLFCGLLGLFWLVSTVLCLATLIQHVNGTRLVYGNGLINGVGKLDFTFNLLYFLAALEIIGLAVMEITSSRSKDSTSKIQPNNSKKLPFLFFALISFPLLIRSIWLLAISARYTLRNSFYLVFDVGKVQTAQLFFCYLCTAVVYAGLVVIMKSLGEETTFTSAHNNGNGVGNGNGGFGPDLPVMRVAAPREDTQPFDPHLTTNQPEWSRVSRDHSQDPIYNGP
ncbi:MAG: hypothetical protein Q9166_002856 [cf. Caloplaca sp. 2 TL-2023]